VSGDSGSKRSDGETGELAAPVTLDDASRRCGPGRHAARERYDELSMRDHLARARDKLKASGRYDPARHGSDDAEPLSAAEHLELLATTEYLSRACKPSFEVDFALRAGASWPQVAAALGTDEASAQVPTASGLTGSTTCSPGPAAGSA
jgi:hypothetical protein